MWKILAVKAQNICSFKELDYEINQNVMTLIFGENLDNDSQKSNGSGKSTLLEAISIGLLNSPLRKVKAEEIINDAADEAMVQLFLANAASHQEMTITRNLSRKSSSSVSVEMLTDGRETPFVYSSVDETNKAILRELGLSKDEILNYFILSKHRYQSFLDSSDKDKKEIINRFSNGIVVDDAIALLRDDLVPLQDELSRLDLDKSRITGAIESTTTQIADFQQKTVENDATRQERITNCKNQITERRATVRQLKERIESDDMDLLSLEGLRALGNQISNDEKTYPSVTDCIAALSKGLSESSQGLPALPDYSSTLQQTERIQQLNDAIEAKGKELSDIQKNIDELDHKVTLLEQDYLVAKQGADADLKNMDITIQSIKDKIQGYNKAIESSQLTQRTYRRTIADLQAKLSGLIECPACHHQFLLDDKEFDAKTAEATIIEKTNAISTENIAITRNEEQIVQSNISVTKLAYEKQERTEKVQKLYSQFNDLNNQLNVEKSRLKSVQSDIELKKANINSITAAIDKLFDTVFDDFEDIINRKVRQLNDDRQADLRSLNHCEGEINSLEQSVVKLSNPEDDNTIQSLQEYLKKYEAELAEVVKSITAQQIEVDKLLQQEATFNEFKTYLANTKIEALSTMTNSFLERIGSDIRIKFSGYTYLKSGKIRDKISISLIRDGLDCGSFFKFSEGEKARVNLAAILAMQKLTNITADTDKGLDLLVLDEILEAADEEGLANMFKTVNNMNITALAVSQGKVAENYPHRLLISKKNGKSQIKNAKTEREN